MSTMKNSKIAATVPIGNIGALVESQADCVGRRMRWWIVGRLEFQTMCSCSILAMPCSLTNRHWKSRASQVVRECALDGLWEAAGNQRPEPGSMIERTGADFSVHQLPGFKFEVQKAMSRHRISVESDFHHGPSWAMTIVATVQSLCPL